MKKGMFILFLGIISFTLFAQQEEPQSPGIYARFGLEDYSITFLLDYQSAPVAVTSFIGLSEGSLTSQGSGEPVYQNMTIDKTIKNYAVFSGIPESSGIRSGIRFPRESSIYSQGEPGIIAFTGMPSMSSADRFFITLSGDPYLDNVYTAFGKVVEGIEHLESLEEGTPIRGIQIIRIGSEAENFVVDQEHLQLRLDRAYSNHLEQLEASRPDLASVIKEWPSYRMTPGGLYYNVIYEGYGEKPVAGNTITAHYTGKLINGTVFDSSVERGAPFKLTLGVDGVIQGWVETLQDMQPGESRVVLIPPEMAYGDRAAGNIIPANSWLLFEIQLLSVE